MTRHAAPPLDASIRAEHVTAEGRDLAVVADAAQRETIAADLGLSALELLEADLNVIAVRGGVRVTGSLRARVVQPCVVTMVPVTQAIEETIDRVFLRGAEKPYSGPANGEVFIDLEDDAPDYFDGPEIDLSPLILETLALAIDPYPRAPDAELDLPEQGGPDAELSPFAKLKALRDVED